MNFSAIKRNEATLCALRIGNQSTKIFIRQLMRISLFTIIILSITVGIMHATTVKGQNISNERVSIALKHESLITAIKQIEQQTSFIFYYRNADIKSIANIVLSDDDRTVEETLTDLLKNTFITYRQVGQNIFIEKLKFQYDYEIKGHIQDIQHKPLALATISVVKTDSHKIQNTLSDINGDFKFMVTEKGDYLIKISSVGMDSLSVGITLADQKSIQIPDITLTTASKQLNEVVVIGKKPFIEQRIDRTILNIENSILSSGRSALDILANAPGVIIENQNDNIKLNNKSGVMVMINGRKSYLSSTDLSNMLRNMSSDQIATIEIITNPSAKYDASGTAGIIDIKLKKNKFYGFNGSASASISQGLVPYGPDDLLRESLNLNLNNRTEKWNTYINLSPSRGTDYSETTLHRNVDFEGNRTVFDNFFTSPLTSTGISSRVGIDYLASKKTIIGVLLDGTFSKDRGNGTSESFLNSFHSGISTPTSLTQNSNTETPRHNLTSNFNVKHDFNDKGLTLTFDATYSSFKNKNEQLFRTNYFDGGGNLTDTTSQRNQTKADINIYSFKADVTVPVSKSLNFEGGLKSDHVRTTNDDMFNQLIAGTWVNVPNQSNYFIYKENVNAAYVNFNKKWTNWSVQAGLRAEQTHSIGNSVTTQKTADSNYVSLFPSIFINQTIDKNNFIRYSYSRRIDRPNYQQLNPFVFYIDPYTVDQGNPFLKPQFTDSYMLSYTYLNKITLTLGYSHTKDYIVQLSEQNDSTKVIKAIQGNLGSHDGYYANLSFPVQIGNWWSMQNQFNLFNDKFNNIITSGIPFNNSKLAYNFRIFNSFVVSGTWGAELSFNYTSPHVNGVETTTKANYSTNFGIQKSLFDKRARFTFNISDIFHTSQYTGISQYQNVDLSVLNRWTSRRASASFIYNFGKQTVNSPRDRSTGVESLKNRAN